MIRYAHLLSAFKIFLSLIFFLLFVQQSFGGEKHNLKQIKLRVHLAPFLTHAPFFIAQEEGYFSEVDLQIDFIKVDESTGVIPAMSQGDLDVSARLVNANFFNAIARGANIKMVADKGYIDPKGCPTFTLVARRVLVEGKKLSHPAQLKSRRIAMIRDPSISGYYIEKVLGMGGLTENDIEIVKIPFAMRFEALEKGSIDLSLADEPWVTRFLIAGHGVVWMPAQQVIPDFQFSTMLYGPALLEKNSDTGKRFMVAYLKAVRQYNRGKTEQNLKILAKHTGLDQELLKKCCWPPLHNGGQINIESIIDFQKWALKKGYLEKEVSSKQFWDPSFIEYANKVLGGSTK